MLFVDDIFESVQGESLDSGLPCLFIRLWGCNIGCAYCDTPQSAEHKTRTSVGKLMDKIHKSHLKRVCITGGEPLLQPEVYPLIYELVSEDYKVSIETSGCIPIEPDNYRRSFRYIMDVKCPSSGVSDKNVLTNLGVLSVKDEVKFVIGDRKDYEYAHRIIRTYPTCAKILFSPLVVQDGNGEWKCAVSRDLVKWIMEDKLTNVRVQIQMHKYLGVK